MVESWELLFDILGNHLISVSPGEVDEEIFQTPGRYLSAVWSSTKFYGGPRRLHAGGPYHDQRVGDKNISVTCRNSGMF